MSTFNQFAASLSPDGKQFERFVKWFLKNDPEWSTQVDKVWLWNEYPNRWGRDCGIDLVFKNKIGETWAVQAKNYSSSNTVTKHDIDKFLSESNRSGIDKRLLIATTDRISANAKQVCDAQEKQVVRYMLWDFERAAIEYPASLSEITTAKRIEPPSPRDYQQEAISNVVSGFNDTDRGQLIMACGTGKTFTALWIKERLGSKSTLFLLPSLSLLSQTLREWTFAASDQFDVLCVCSDETVVRRGADEAISSVSDLHFPVKSDIQSIRDFLAKKGDKVIFCTYQSSPLIAEAQEKTSIAAFDLIVADEAHRCAGVSDGQFSTAVDSNLIRSKKRLFMTATPRTYTTTVKKAAEGRGIDIVGMDDEASFGKVLHSLPFSEAISRNPPLLTDYRVVIVGVDDEMISQRIEGRELLQTQSGLTIDAESLAAQIGLIKAIKDYEIKSAISFHSRISRAKGFSEELQLTISELDKQHKPKARLWTDFVSGAMSTDKRRRKLQRLKQVTKTKRGLLSNARCLSEGVDVPSLDAVAFIDPRRSQVDIIQAVGRAIRLSETKTVGTIVLPVFIGESKDAVQTIETSRFKPVWDVINALKSHDDELSEQLNSLRFRLGRRSGSTIDTSDLSKIVIDIPKTVDASFAESLRSLLVQKTTEPWISWYGMLRTFCEEYKHAIVPFEYKNPEGHALGHWVSGQRKQRDEMSEDRRSLLEDLPNWSWDVKRDMWEEGYRELEAYALKVGNCWVDHKYQTEDGFRLGSWVKEQRITRRKNLISDDRIRRLENLPNWSWDLLEERWNEAFSTLKRFSNKEGHCEIPTSVVTKTGVKIRNWITDQKRLRDSMTNERMNLLQSLPGWTWDKKYNERWDAGFAALVYFSKSNGHCRVPRDFKTKDGIRLGHWIRTQRKKREKLSKERISRLESVEGWVWDVFEEKWEEGFEALKHFVDSNGHCRIPHNLVTPTGFRLGSWVQYQKTYRQNLSENRIERLESQKGWSWKGINEQIWDAKFEVLKNFSLENGHCEIPYKSKFTYQPGDIEFDLYSWKRDQQAKRALFSYEKAQQFEKLAGWEWVDKK